MERRAFLRGVAGAVGAAALGPRLLSLGPADAAVLVGNGPYGPLQAADANGIQLPAGFTSRLIGTSGQTVPGTSYVWPPAPDGGACFPAADGGWVYVANSEVGTAGGGASAVRFAASGAIVAAYRILGATSRNCAGGPTPWGTWLSCEENGVLGRVYECDPQQAGQGTVRPLLGSFNHEAAVVDPAAGHVYLTEDDPAGRLYRFTPTTPGDLAAGSLYAAKVTGSAVTWVPTSSLVPDRSSGTTAFNGGEGAWIAAGTLWFTTKGDRRVWELDLATQQLTLLYDHATVAGSPLNAVDNITRHERSGDLFVAEDGGNMEVCLITTLDAQDVVAPFLRFTGHSSSEVTGPAFSPDGTRLYVSSQRGTDGATGRTYEITGPFRDRTSPPAAEVLVPAGATWRYLDDGSDQGTAWSARTYADTAWKQGPAPLGYGDPMATTIGYGADASAKHITTYFRRTFEATHGFAAVSLRLRRDDGAVVYVNGTEVARSNLPSGPITARTLASAAIGGADETAYVTMAVTPTLYAGTNVIAVEVHQSGGTSTDLGFDLALEGTGDTGPLPPPPPAPVPTTLPVLADGHVRDGTYQSTSFGSATALEVCKAKGKGANRIAYLRLDTASVAGPIASARLRLHCRNATSATATTVQVLAVASTTWSEASLTWRAAPPRGSTLGSFAVTSTTAAWKEVDVTAYVNAQRAAGRTAVAFAVVEPANGQVVSISSREAAANRPELRLDQ